MVDTALLQFCEWYGCTTHNNSGTPIVHFKNGEIRFDENKFLYEWYTDDDMVAGGCSYKDILVDSFDKDSFSLVIMGEIYEFLKYVYWSKGCSLKKPFIN